MADQDPLADVLTLLVTPISSTVRSVEQFRKGVDEFLRGVENFNKTMENLNETAERINVLLEEVEQPVRAALPQVTRAVQNADEMMQVVSGPAMALAPSLRQFSDMMSTPAVQQLPAQLALFNEVMGEMMSRMGPLAQFAESAGGMFGFRRPGSQSRPAAPATPAAAGPASRPAAEPEPEPEPESAPEPEPARQATAEKPTVEKPTAKKSAAKKPAAKKPAAKKRAAKKRAAGKKT